MSFPLPLPPPVRSFARRLVYCWHWVHDRVLGEWRGFLDRRRAFRRSIPILQDIHGARFVLYPCDRPNILHLIRRTHDLNEFQAIPHLLNPGDTALDVGANLGFYSVLLSRLCGPAGRVFAFEPVPDTYWRLRETITLNRCGNVVPIQAAVCDKSGTAKMNLFAPQFSEWNSLGMPAMPAQNGAVVSPLQSVEVPAMTLDDFCTTNRIDHIHFLKVDVEGFEVSVFQGAKRLLREHRVDYICFEISKIPLAGAGMESRKVFQALEMHGYAAYQFDPRTHKFYGPLADTAETWTNFFASWIDLTKIEEIARTPQSVRLAQEVHL